MPELEITNDVLLVLVKQVVEDLFVQKRYPLKVISTPRLKTDDFINKSIRFVAEVCDVLLPLHFLLDIS